MYLEQPAVSLASNAGLKEAASALPTLVNHAWKRKNNPRKMEGDDLREQIIVVQDCFSDILVLSVGILFLLPERWR